MNTEEHLNIIAYKLDKNGEKITNEIQKNTNVDKKNGKTNTIIVIITTTISIILSVYLFNAESNYEKTINELRKENSDYEALKIRQNEEIQNLMDTVTSQQKKIDSLEQKIQDNSKKINSQNQKRRIFEAPWAGHNL